MNKFQTYLNQPLAKISPDNLDIYTIVVKKGKRKVAKNYVYFLLSKGNENFVDGNTNAGEIMNVKAFLTEYLIFTIQYTLDNKIASQQEEIADLENDLKSINKSVEKLKSNS